jgi:hypothetical protein
MGGEEIGDLVGEEGDLATGGKGNGYFLGRRRSSSPVAGLSKWIRFEGQVKGIGEKVKHGAICCPCCC